MSSINKTFFRHKSFVYFSADKIGDLPFENFISRKLLRSEIQSKKVSRPIVRISVASIALAIVVNLITISVVTGFQKEVTNKVSGFGSHILIMGSGENSIYECEPIRKEQSFIKKIIHDPEIKSIAPIAYKPVLFQSDNTKRVIQTGKGDTSYVQKEIMAAILKGVDSTYDMSFFSKTLISGRLPKIGGKHISEELLLSEQIVKALNLKLNDRVRAFFVKNQPVQRMFKLVGIYRSGLEEFDRKTAIVDIRFVQQLSDWGIQANINVEDTLSHGKLIIRAQANGGNGNFRYDWGNGYEPYAGFVFCPVEDTILRAIVSDYSNDIHGRAIKSSIPDTAYLNIKISGKASSECIFKTNGEGYIQKRFLDYKGEQFSIESGSKLLHFHSRPGKGSFTNYVGGFEINVRNWDHLNEVTESLKRTVSFFPNEYNESLSVINIQENQPDIFAWLGFLDINVIIILSLMILIGIINMSSALLVMILMKSNFIGLMKAMGATNWSIRKIFLNQAGWLIVRGMIIGNAIGLGLCIIQKKWGLIKLDPEVYYLDQVPVSLNLAYVLILNACTLVVCLGALLIPSVAVARMNPVKSIKFN
jgi:lipoprotein-releasing system permease protein